MKRYPLVSFIILNWNGKDRLKKCLASIKKVKYPKIEIIVVNNGSTDNSKDFLNKYYPDITVVELKKNVGYPKGKNIGVSRAKGNYILSLDNDTEVTPNFLSPLIKDLESDSTIGIVQPQIRSMIHKDSLDFVIAFLTFTGFLYYFGYMKKYHNKKYLKPVLGYSIKGACFLISKKDYVSLGGLDESFISYVEETDLCHRMWLYGKKVLYEPKSVIYHFGGSDTQRMEQRKDSIYRSFRNRIISYIKNLSTEELIKTLPIHIICCELLVLVYLVKFKFDYALTLQNALAYPLFHMDQILKKRDYIQKKIRKIPDYQINEYIKKNPRLSYYWHEVVLDDISSYQD